MQASYGAHNHTVSTQVDVVPTIVSLLGKPFVHQYWGRDLLTLPENDDGLGIIKPSGSDHTVALLRGDRITIKPPKGKIRSGTYSLYSDDVYQPDKTVHNDKYSAAELNAFIQVAIQALYGNRTGLPDTHSERQQGKKTGIPFHAGQSHYK
jgi:phosphoglycerol transferase MdoB-like AlkP superfamily enzyme